MNMRSQTNWTLRLLLVAAMMLLLAAVAWAQYDPRGGAALIDEQQLTVEGEVKAFKRFEGELLMVMVEWPVVIRVNEHTVFDSADGRPVSLYSASSLLPGKPVRLYPRQELDGSYVAEKIMVLTYEDLLRIRKVRAENMAPVEQKQKDEVPRFRRR